MNEREYTRRRQHRVARVAIAASTVRGQGPPGCAQRTREFLKGIKLDQLVQPDERRFLARLEALTTRLQRAVPRPGLQWGSARKFLNIFLRDSLYDGHVSSTFDLHRIERWLEVPLDGDVGHRLGHEPEGAALPRWTTIKALSPDVSRAYQLVAQRVADRHAVARVHLDLLYWTGVDGKPRARR